MKNKRKRFSSNVISALSKPMRTYLFLAVVLLGMVDLAMGQTNIDQTLRDIERLRSEDNKNQLTQKLVEAAYYYWDNQNKAEAIKLLEESAEVSAAIGNDNGVANAYHNIGVIKAEQGQFASSIDYQQRAVAIKEQQGDKRMLANYTLNLGSTYFKAGQLPQAIEALERSLALGKELNIAHIKTDSYLTLSEVYEKQGNKEKALEYFKLYNEKYDEEGQQFVAELENEYEAKQAQLQAEKRKKEQELVAKQQELQIAELQKKEAEAAARAKEREVELLNKTKELQQAELEAGRRVLAFAVVFVVFVLVFGVFMIRANRKMKFANKKLELQKKAISEQRDAIEEKNGELNKAYSSIQSSITYAERIQQASLPEYEAIASAFHDLFIFFKPRDVVSGDFYWFAQVRDPATGNVKKVLAAIDCTGHGVPGAFMSLVGNSALNQIVNERRIVDPAIILSVLNERIIQMLKQETRKNQDGMDMALVVVDDKAGTLEFAGAKNPLFFMKNGELHTIKGSRKPIGGKMYQGATYEKHLFEIDAPMTCYIFSDGYQDQFSDENDSRFMTKRLKNLIKEHHTLPMKDQHTLFAETFTNWKGGYKQVDDVLVIGFKVTPKDA